MREDNRQHRVFGVKENAEYRDREGAYLIPVRGEQVAVVRIPKGLFLLGGGIENGESHSECIRRECLEEIGYTILIEKEICSAETYWRNSSVGYFHPIQTYYVGKLIEKVQEPLEQDHELVWMDREQLRGQMFAEMQDWALEEVFSQKCISL